MSPTIEKKKKRCGSHRVPHWSDIRVLLAQWASWSDISLAIILTDRWGGEPSKNPSVWVARGWLVPVNRFPCEILFKNFKSTRFVPFFSILVFHSFFFFFFFRSSIAALRRVLRAHPLLHLLSWHLHRVPRGARQQTSLQIVLILTLFPPLCQCEDELEIKKRRKERWWEKNKEKKK